MSLQPVQYVIPSYLASTVYIQGSLELLCGMQRPISNQSLSCVTAQLHNVSDLESTVLARKVELLNVTRKIAEEAL